MSIARQDRKIHSIALMDRLIVGSFLKLLKNSGLKMRERASL